MSQEGINNRPKNNEVNNIEKVNYGKNTISKITKFLSDIINESSSKKESKGNFLKSEKENQDKN
ncbi:MAG: hypothetical protein KBD12_02885 [Candidatus Pacebacteria bacterium]|nr:hypothetical protein [Candidatus Paceibacterota bacterium]